ncbi:Major facilitator superfamily [Neofusicoccum parvum]|uniref:Putative siderophore iron transporter protein n=1 Tax=Botryosphaeria parva (strain UCR-NP2) TaxID=1287680 RepID=R1EZI6_BOTPV|nr:putative siderophore iron transporter protein [Neofusicoccum parvum UCRNP2]GME33060.1 Major facilitator superfamily [Neofusicoccum parvum]
MPDDSISTSPRYENVRNGHSKPFELRSQGSGTFDESNKAGSSILFDEENGEHVQQGVKEAEAITQTWTKKSLIIAYLLILIVFFVDSLEQQISNNLLPYVYSSFAAHSLVTTASIMSSIIGAVVKLPIAKMIDIWGRPQGYVVMIMIATIGLILLAACKSVEMYAAAQVFYWVGFNGIGYVLDVFIADTSALRNRGLIFAFTTTPYIATTFAGPSAAQQFLDHSSWRWGYGVFAIVVPVVTTPVAMIFLVNRRKAEREGKIEKVVAGRTWGEAVKYYLVEFDVVGMLLICAGFALLILPLTLATYQADKWRSASIICMIVFGGLSLIGFYVWEKFFAPVRFLPFHLLTDRTVLGACCCSCIIFIAYYCWDYYFTSYLQVVHELSVSSAGYVGNIFNIGSCFFAVPVGLAIRQTNRFKWCALISVPWMIIGTGLMCYFRNGEWPIGYIVMCQLFIAFAGGTVVICEEMAVMSSVAHAANTETGGSGVAVVLALLSLFSGIGGAVGLGVSGAIWTNIFPVKLLEYLPDDRKADVPTLYSSLVLQLAEPVGSPAREAIVKAYVVAQQRMCIAATCILAAAIPCVVVWKDYNLRDVRQAKGTVA